MATNEFSVTGTILRVATPIFNRITLYGYVYGVGGVAVQGAEVTLSLAASPQANGNTAIGRETLTVTTNADGYWEMNPVAGAYAVLTCTTVGYSRKGILPASGALNWLDFAKANT